MNTLLPADTYKVYKKGLITEEKIKILSMLYQPIIGISAVSLYLSLLYDSNVENNYTHHHLMSNMMVELKTILKSREKLEAIGLLKTYYKEDNVNEYIYELYSPISAYEFLNNPILNIILLNNVGKIEYDNIVETFKTKRLNLKDYNDITKSFDEVFTTVNGYTEKNYEVESDQIRRLEIKSNIDIDLIINSIPKNLYTEKCFNKDVINLIINLSYLYKIDNKTMSTLVRNSLNERGLLDQSMLREISRNHYTFENSGKLPTLIYSKQPEHLKDVNSVNSEFYKYIKIFENITPYEFLKKKYYNNSEPTGKDKKIIEGLMIDLSLPAGVINVLLDYIYRAYDKKIDKNLVEAIAGDWKKHNIETVLDAMEYIRKQHNRKNSTLNKNINKNLDNRIKNNNTNSLEPEWFNKEFEANNDNKEELENLFNGLD